MGLGGRVLEIAARAMGRRLEAVETPRRRFLLRQSRRTIETTSRRIHYGCGGNLLDGWVNVDMSVSRREGVESVICDLAMRHPFPDGWFSFGYASDFLEHLSQAQALLFLYEVHRTFCRDGVLRLSFPSFSRVLAKHFSGNARNILEEGVCEAYEKWGHRHFFDATELELACRHVGFASVRRCSYGESAHAELRGLESREHQRSLNMIVEVVR